jgi:hypothetical protein
MPRRFLLALAISALVLGLMPGLAAAEQPSLTTEHLIVSNSFGSSEESYLGTMSGSFVCAPDGPPALDLSVDGNAYGPYPGTFHQTVTAVIDGGLVISYDLTFQIVSGGTTIDGEAHYTGSGADGTCTHDTGEDLYRFSAGSRAGGGNGPLVLEYSATVTTSSGSSSEAGVVDASINLYCPGAPDPAGCESASSTLYFLGLTAPRHAEGEDGAASTGTEATASDPVATGIVNPAGGFVQITEEISTPDVPTGYTILGRTLSISADVDATVDDPIRLVFTLDASILVGLDPSDVTVLRDGVPALDCDGTKVGDITSASPDPCVESRTPGPTTGDLTITVLTSHASSWDVVSTKPIVQPPDEPPPTSTASSAPSGAAGPWWLVLMLVGVGAAGVAAARMRSPRT